MRRKRQTLARSVPSRELPYSGEVFGRFRGCGSKLPTGSDPTPSQADIQITNAINDIVAPLGISVHDHPYQRIDGCSVVPLLTYQSITATVD
jgi:hypothetical protein